MPICLIKKLIEKLKRRRVGIMGSVANINMDEVAYAEWSCICIGKSYGETISCDYDRTYWIPGLVAVPKPPISPPSCKNHKNWECIVVYVMLEETRAKETSEFIRKSGGLITETQFDEYINKRKLY
jgi:hypothetical protein